ncbi:hypothetical protein BJ165DRAFT_1479953 [Panaeolus papilionaceus]|nr:hypothetical protein BJ165DRAFT_1479953 [Panaeolus papilionaceus]
MAAVWKHARLALLCKAVARRFLASPPSIPGPTCTCAKMCCWHKVTNESDLGASTSSSMISSISSIGRWLVILFFKRNCELIVVL